MTGSGAGRLVYQPVMSRIGAAAYGVFAIWWVAEAVLDGGGATVAVAGPLLLAVGLAVYGVFWRPAVIVDDEAVELRNVLRDVRVSWPSLEAVDTRFALTLLIGDSRFRSWAAAAPGRPSPLAGAVTGRQPQAAGDAIRSSRSLQADSGAAAFMVNQRWEARRHVGGASQVTVRWVRIWPAIAVASLVTAGLAAVLT